MDIKDINSIGESSFYGYSLADTMVVLDALEAQDWSNIHNKILEENSSFCTRLLDIVDDRIHKNDFAELVDNAEGRNHILLHVLRIRTSISQYRLLCLRNDVEQTVLEQVRIANKKFEETEKSINVTIQAASDEVQQTSDAVKDSINKHLTKSQTQFETTINDKIKSATDNIEPQIMTTILTLMGVFSAIITIIMSVVITSSSWLNNANGASAIIAFIVPNLVVAFSISILLGVVFSRRSGKYIVISGDDWNHETMATKALQKVRRTQTTTILMVVIFTVICIAFALFEMKINDEPHTRYIFTEDMYDCVEIEDDTSEQSVLVIEFNFSGKNYRFLYDESYFHDGSIYFCEEHERLE